MHVAKFVIIDNAQTAAAKRIGHRLGDFGLRFHQLGPAFFDAGILLLLGRDGRGATHFGASPRHARVGFGLVSSQAGADVFAHIDVGNINRDNLERGV